MNKPRKKKMQAAVRTGKPLGLWIPTEVKDALQRLADKRFRTLTGEILLALKRHFEAEGMEWPLKEDRDGRGE
jgi:hypothetical protein